MAERDLIRWIAQRAKKHSSSLVRGIGDDCAVIENGPGQMLLVSTDTLTSGVHFFEDHHPPRLLGRKAAAVNASDVNAMGGRAKHAFLSVAVPPEKDDIWMTEMLEGFIQELDGAGCSLAGGDTVASAAGLTLTVTVLGNSPADEVVYRLGSKPEDLVWVSNTVGDAAVGLFLLSEGHVPYDPNVAPWGGLVAAHLAPEPPLDLGPYLATTGMIHAMIDVSDGIATDLAHLALAADIGAEIDAARLPLSHELLTATEHFSRDPAAFAVHGGEDFELLFTTPAMDEKKQEIFLEMVKKTTGSNITVIGRMTEEKGVRLIQDDSCRDITFQGYEHPM